MKYKCLITQVTLLIIPFFGYSQDLKTADFDYDRVTSDTLFDQVTRIWYKNGEEVKQQNILLQNGMVLFEKTKNDSNIITQMSYFETGLPKSKMRVNMLKFKILSMDAWYSNAAKKLEVRYKGSYYTVYNWDSLGRIAGRQKWDDNLNMTDTVSYYFANGALFKQYRMDHGKILDVSTYDTLGNKITKGCIANGNGIFYNYALKSGIITLSSIQEFKNGYSNGNEYRMSNEGDTSEIVTFKNGKKDGAYVQLKKGKILSKGNYVNDKKNGIFIFNNNEGKPRYEVSFTDGEMISARCIKPLLHKENDKKTIGEFLQSLFDKTYNYDTLITKYFHSSMIHIFSSLFNSKDFFELFDDISLTLKGKSFKILDYTQMQDQSTFKTNVDVSCEGFYTPEEIYVVKYEKQSLYFLMEDNKIKSCLPYSVDGEHTIWFPFDACDSSDSTDF